MQHNIINNNGVETYADVMTVHDLAKYLQLSDAKIYRMARAGTLPVIRIGKTWRFKKDMIDSWLRQVATNSFNMV